MDRASVYVDGALKGWFSAANFDGISADHLTLGACRWMQDDGLSGEGIPSTGDYFTGRMDEVRLWNVALNETLVAKRNNTRLAGNEAGLLLYLPFEEVIRDADYNINNLEFHPDNLALDGNGNAQPNAAPDNTGVLQSEDAPAIKDVVMETNIEMEAVVNDDAIILTPRQGINAWNDFEQQIVTFTVTGVQDMNGNRMGSPVTWTAFIDRNHVRWAEAERHVECSLYEGADFTVDIVNVGGMNQGYTVQNLPSWLDVSEPSGTLAPASTHTLQFRVSEALNVGTYDQVLYLVNDNNVARPLNLTVKVNGDELTEGEIGSFRAKGNEAISFGDGTDVTESSHEEERESQPKLEPASSVGAVTFVSQYGKTGRQKFTVGDISGEAIEGEVIEPVQNVKIESVNVRPENGRKVVALTFDDGPSKYTQQYLDILSKYGARATFFCLGSQIPGNEGLVQAIKNQGSQVASHTQNHEQLTLLDPDALRSEVTQTFSAISSAGGGDTTVLRPPYGALDTSTWAASGGTFSASIIWNLDSLDWELPGVDTIVENCTLGVTSGSIILMHDGGGNRDQDVEALPRIIETLQGQGYELVTINELLATDSRIPESVASGNATIPEGHVWASEVVE